MKKKLNIEIAGLLGSAYASGKIRRVNYSNCNSELLQLYKSYKYNYYSLSLSHLAKQ